MNLLNVNFDELYRRHLCRHSQFGINVMHLIAVVGIYISLFGIAYSFPEPAGQWIVGGVLVVYFGILLLNVPFTVWVATLLFIGLLFAAFRAAPLVPWWVYVLLIFVWHKFQNWNHDVYDESHDMSEFAEKYQKGFPLFFLLSVYELPILLHCLLFDRAHWAARRAAKQ
ncbi:MAG: hypothetical protein AAGA92_15445 [Planctomycetota bacterium]